MFLYLIDLDDTLVDTFRHACDVIYPRVAAELGTDAPSEADMLRTWGRPLQHTLGELFSGTDWTTARSALRIVHAQSPPPMFAGVADCLELIMSDRDKRLVVFSAGDPEVVRNTLENSLGSHALEQGAILIHHLPLGRRLAPIDIDIARERTGITTPERVLVFSDASDDFEAVRTDPLAIFFGIATPHVSSRRAHIEKGVPGSQVFGSLQQALDSAIAQRFSEHRANATISLDPLEQAVRDRQLLVFLGAGVSADSGLPTGTQLASEFGYDGDSLDRAMTALGPDSARYSALYRIFANPNLRPSKIHRALALLDAPYYIGTNWDHLLETALKDLYGSTYEDHVGVAYEDDQLPRIIGKHNAYLKLHGDISSRDSLVHDKRSYASRIKNPTLVDQLAHVLLNTSVVLFVGSSVEDTDVVAELLSHVEWRGGVPPERYVLVPNSSEQVEAYFKRLNVAVIDLEVPDDTEIGRKTFEFLLQLCDLRDTFSTDVQLLSMGHAPSRLEMFHEALAYYGASEFSKALAAVDELRQQAIDWRQDPLLLARFSYLAVKIYDKLERWNDIRAFDQLYVADHFSRVELILPGSSFEWLQGHYLSGLALASLRAGEPHDALRHSDLAIAAARREGPFARLLLADRRVVRAMTVQYLVQMGETHLASSAWDDLSYARVALERFGGLGTQSEAHFCGRFYGSVVFLALTAPLTADDPRGSLCESLSSYATMSHTAGRRVPYGVVAGRYCETAYHMLTGADSKRLQVELDELDDATRLVEVGPSVADRIAWLRARTHGDAGLAPQVEAPYTAIHRKLLGIDGWLATPLN